MLNQAGHLPVIPSMLRKSPGISADEKTLEKEFSRYYVERMLPVTRVAIGLGLVLILVVCALDILFKPRAFVQQAIPLRAVATIIPLSALLAATYLAGIRTRLPHVLVGGALIVGCATIAIHAVTPATEGSMPAWGVLVVTLNAYLLLGLMVRQAATVGCLLLLIYASAGAYFGIPVDELTYATALLVFANLAGTYASFQSDRDAREIFDNERELARLASTDGLTGLFNRHAFDQHLRRLLKQARREHHQVAVMVADIDHFKLYNDCYGHKMGDDCLKAIANVLAHSVKRPLDMVARYGGEEFIIFLYDPSPDFLASFTETLCEKVVCLGIEHKASEQAGQCVSLSIGAAMSESSGPLNDEQLIRQAEDALFEAKTQGRNRAVVYRTEWGQQTTAHLAHALL